FGVCIAQRDVVVNRIPIDSWGQVFFLPLTESGTVKGLWNRGSLAFRCLITFLLEVPPKCAIEAPSQSLFFGHKNEFLDFQCCARFAAREFPNFPGLGDMASALLRCVAYSSGTRFKKGNETMRKLFIFILSLSLGFASAAAFGQQPTGSVEGTVKDPQGAVVQNATITIRNVATNSSRSGTTSDNGQYRFSEM